MAFTLFCMASTCLGAPQFGYQNRYANQGYGTGFANSGPTSLNRFRYAPNPFRTQSEFNQFNRNNNFGRRRFLGSFNRQTSSNNFGNFNRQSGSNNFGNFNRQAGTGNVEIPSIPSIVNTDEGPSVDTDFGK